MLNLIAFIICMIGAIVNCFAFPLNPKWLRGIAAGICVFVAIVNLCIYLFPQS